MPLANDHLILKAPGKIVISGEHAVMYGKGAIVATIDKYTYFDCAFNKDAGKIVITNNNDFKMMLFNTDCLIEISENYLCQNLSKPPLLSNDMIDEIQNYFRIKYEDSIYKYTQNKSCLVIILAFVMGVPLNKLSSIGITINISSDIPIGHGLGSSASFSACLSLLILYVGDIVTTSEDVFSNIECINKWAFTFDNIFHGKASGMDNTSVVYGGILHFVNTGFYKLTMEHNISFLIIDTKLSKCTALSVCAVRELNELYPCITSKIFDCIDEITLNIKDLLIGEDEWDLDKYKKLSKLIDLNHHFLACLGLESIANSEIYNICKAHGFSSKITGGGNNGCMIVISPNTFKVDDDLRLKYNKLLNLRSNFDIKNVEIVSEGVSMEKVKL